jgi:hypothetical protein
MALMFLNDVTQFTANFLGRSYLVVENEPQEEKALFSFPMGICYFYNK